MSPSTPLRDMANHERPRERMQRHGARSLSDAELVAIQLGSGRPGESALDLAQALLAEWGGVAGLARADTDELARRHGIGPAKAARLVSAFALARRAIGAPEGRSLASSADIAAIAVPLIGHTAVEELLLLVADNQHRVRRTVLVARGSASHCAVPIREILSLVLRHDGLSFALAHNHPGGTVAPSADDVAATQRLQGSSADVGLRLLDHVIVAGDQWSSVSASR